jgi:acetyl esterase/lipase
MSTPFPFQIRPNLEAKYHPDFEAISKERLSKEDVDPVDLDKFKARRPKLQDSEPKFTAWASERGWTTAKYYIGQRGVFLVVTRPLTGARPKRCIYFIHGGAFIASNAYVGLKRMVEWADELDAAVVSVEYRLAGTDEGVTGEGPIEDCYDGLLYLFENMRSMEIDAKDVVVYGASAGGGRE